MFYLSSHVIWPKRPLSEIIWYPFTVEETETHAHMQSFSVLPLLVQYNNSKIRMQGSPVLARIVLSPEEPEAH